MGATQSCCALTEAHNLFGIVTTMSSTILLSSAINHRTVAIRPRAMVHHASLHGHKSIESNLLVTCGPFYISKVPLRCTDYKSQRLEITDTLLSDRRTRLVLDLLRLGALRSIGSLLRLTRTFPAAGKLGHSSL